MSFVNFHYRLVEIYQIAPKKVDLLPAFNFTKDWEDEQIAAGTNITVKSESFYNDGENKVFYGESRYFVSLEQPSNPHEWGNSVLAELIYQHLCRQVDAVYAITQGKVILTAPTVWSILADINSDEN